MAGWKPVTADSMRLFFNVRLLYTAHIILCRKVYSINPGIFVTHSRIQSTNHPFPSFKNQSMSVVDKIPTLNHLRTAWHLYIRIVISLGIVMPQVVCFIFIVIHILLFFYRSIFDKISYYLYLHLSLGLYGCRCIINK